MFILLVRLRWKTNKGYNRASGNWKAQDSFFKTSEYPMIISYKFKLGIWEFLLFSFYKLHVNEVHNFGIKKLYVGVE